jgi:hypothetical protein
VLRSIDDERVARNEAVFSANREVEESNYNKINIDYRRYSEDMPARKELQAVYLTTRNSRKTSSAF